MSGSAFITQADQALTNHLYSQLKADPTTQALLTSPEQIILNPSKRADQKSKLTLLLYHVTAENAARNTPTAERGALEAPFTLRYLVYPCTGKAEEDHALLGGVVRSVLAAPIIAASEERQDLRLTLGAVSVDELSRLWLALGIPFHAAVTVTVLLKAAYAAPEEAIPVVAPTVETSQIMDRYQVVQQTFVEQVSSWKKRNVFQRQWILQDFKTNTDMAAEEMQTVLNSLGEKLHAHSPIAEFAEPLEKLSKFYVHQRDGLKGMEKFSAKQRENVAMIEGWIRDVDALREALDFSTK